MNKLQQLARDGFFGSSGKSLANCEPPLCKACIHGKQHTRPIHQASLQPLDSFHLTPGDCVSADQIESTQPGIILIFKRSPSTSFYHAGTLFVDHASRFLFFTPHISTGAHEAIEAKNKLEFYAAEFNRTIKRYHADNGVFTSKAFRDSCIKHCQPLTFCGVDAHHQNGIAERYIRTITEHARTMLIHAILHWPDIIQESLWPFAVKLAIDIHNSTPTPSGLCPLEIFSGHKNIHPNNLSNFHTFGCPIFVLDPSLCQNHKIPKWKPRSRVGVYLGQSSEHASSVPLVLSTTTGLVSPQFHVVFDDKFSTVDCLHSNKLPANWADLFTTSSVIYVDEDFTKTTYYPFSQPNSTNNSTPFEPSTSLQRESITSPIFQREPSSPLQTTTVQHLEHPTIHQPPMITPPGWNNLHPYNTRLKKQHIATFSSLTDIPTFSDQIVKSYLSTHDLFPSQHDPSFQHIQHHTFTDNTKDVLNFREMQSDTDRALFETDMQRELANLISSGTLELTPRSSTSSLNKALQPIWSF